MKKQIELKYAEKKNSRIFFSKKKKKMKEHMHRSREVWGRYRDLQVVLSAGGYHPGRRTERDVLLRKEGKDCRGP